ncbi:hypothetical protein CERSUDRAFT_109816 [Gelatoporia subvermispora B]|uniref:F-box domain-containing protein n=1 Tax=Ceriporiopsis subvermispora (strain B) TaxID=914234 RepID=M2R9U5_CERS8|nr:hypothetical protein CERSUDRAFT_109816 [Gelatoporia subvermispora B]
MDEGERYDSGSSGEDETCDSGEYESDGSGECEPCGSEEYNSHERAEYELEDEPSKDVRVRPLSPGSLPGELWDSILKIVDDGRALLAAGCTCKALRDIVEEIVDTRRRIGAFDLACDPTRGYFLRTAIVDVAQLPAWISTYDMKTLRVQGLWIQGSESGWSLALRPPMRCALSLLTLVTTLNLRDTGFSSFSEFARLVCSLPNLATLSLRAVTVNDRGSPTLKGAYFAHDLRLERLIIDDCAFGASHPIWNLLTAPSLSDSLKHIDVHSHAIDSQRALQELSVPPAALYSENLAQLTTLRLLGWNLFCRDISSTVCCNALSRSRTGRAAAVVIDYCCQHSPPHLDEWKSLFSALDDTVTAGEFSCLKTISVSFEADHPFDVDSVRTLLSSQLHSSKWIAAFTMSSMVFEPGSVDEPHSVREEGSEKTQLATGKCTEGATFRIELGYAEHPRHKVTVGYARRQSP